jgi:superfamily I DNA/RNA helicase
MPNLTEEQIAAVQHPVGEPAICIAGAGAGKTSTLTERVRWLINEGVSPRRIAVITFTNRAAGEVLSRLQLDPTSHDIPRVSTIHSLALSGIRKSPSGFGLTDKITPLDDYDQKQMIKKLVERIRPEAEPWSTTKQLLEKIGYHRAKGVGFKIDYTEEVHKATLASYLGYHAMDEPDLELWEEFELQKQKTGSLDFDDMLHFFNRRLKMDENWRNAVQRQFDHVLQDEAQDTSVVQWELVNGLLAPSNYNLYTTGDLSQCQPPGTKVKVIYSAKRRGQSPLQFEWKPIEFLKDGDRVTSWHKNATYDAGSPIKVAARKYSGQLLKISTEKFSTECTPNHWNWVRFNRNTLDKYAVYLMYRSDLGFRLGVTVFKRSTGKTGRGAYGMVRRMQQEKAEKGWFLRLCDSRSEAEAWEEMYSVKYGIPKSLFEATSCWNKSPELIKMIFSYANPEGGRACLLDHNLLEDYPIATYKEAVRGVPEGPTWRGYFKTVAANIIPELMDIPIEGQNKSAQITQISRRHYEGLVYSLDVEQYHTYIADGLVVGNSIMSFNGSDPSLLFNFSKGWRGLVPKLYKISRNHRSVPDVIHLANKIQVSMTGVIPLQMTQWRENGGTSAIKLISRSLPQDIAAYAAQEIQRDAQRKNDPIKYKENAILVRTAMQMRDIEGELVRRRIPYIVRGGMGLLQTEEVRDIMSYLRLAVNHKDFIALSRAVGIPKRGVGKVTLEKLRQTANVHHQGDFVAACRQNAELMVFASIIDHIGMFADKPAVALDKALSQVKYKTYLNDKYKRDLDKLKVKISNLEKFFNLVLSLSEDGVKLDDLIFRLTMDRPAEDEKVKVLRDFDNGKLTGYERDARLKAIDDGAVIISTIHAAKGLEWKRVFCTNLVEGSLPHKLCTNEDEIEEEKRVWYVAVTRARDELVLCIPEAMRTENSVIRLQPSRFLVNLGLVRPQVRGSHN